MEIVAECGCNFRNIKEAKEMIRESKLAGASYSKFQLYSWAEIKDAPDLIREDLQKIMLTRDTAKELFEYGKQINQKVFFTPMHLEAVDWISELEIPLIKIRYADRSNFPLIEKVLQTGKRVIMSIDNYYAAGMESRDYFNSADLITTHSDQIDFLYCVSEYPASVEDYDLTLSTFQCFSGVSDHTKGLEVAKKALSLGANIIEKHVMLSGTHPIEEKWSITFEKLRELKEGEKVKWQKKKKKRGLE